MMNENYREYYWHTLDNAAKLYSCVSTENISNVFRISAMLSEPVQPEILYQALEETLEEIPFFRVKMRKGFFWYYFESNFSKPLLREDNSLPCTPMDRSSNRGYLFRLSYLDRHIHFEVFHALADGNGAIIFLQTLLCRYLHALYPQAVPSGLSIRQDSPSLKAMEENSFAHHTSEPKGSGIPAKVVKAFHIDGVRTFRGGMKVIQGFCSASKAVKLARAEGATLTAYLTALFAFSVYAQSYQYSRRDKPLIINVPINLRNLYESSTMRNFFACVNLEFRPAAENIPFRSFLEEAVRQLQEGQKTERLSEQMARNVTAERNPAMRAVPLFLKNPVLNYMFLRNEKGQTSTVSNMGRITLPEELQPFVRRLEVLVPATYSQNIKLGLVSCGDVLACSFTSRIEETDVQRFFFRFLREQGLDIRLGCNEPS
ncbi:MAG: hypothetical protein HFE44_05170 [Oscillospiraceae bacterium]|jgi:hypothetical protein|nr:hypothetical protein [Oscillospiraceae bacterium]